MGMIFLFFLFSAAFPLLLDHKYSAQTIHSSLYINKNVALSKQHRPFTNIKNKRLVDMKSFLIAKPPCKKHPHWLWDQKYSN